MTPTARTMAYLRGLGYEVAVVEKWNAYTRTRHDLYGFADLLAMRGIELLAVQATSTGNVSARVKNILAEPRALKWVEPGSQRFLTVIGWAKRGPRGKRKVWSMKQVVVDAGMFPEQKGATV